jgi:hypothetical protein
VTTDDANEPGEGTAENDDPAEAQAAIARAAFAIRDAAYQYLVGERGVRVEDYLTVLAALTGEAALVASGLIDIETAAIKPGSGIFGDAVNEVLSGDATDLDEVGSASVVGLMRDGLVPGVVAGELFDLERLYRFVAEKVGSVEWGMAAVSVPEANQPTVLPLRAAFEMRPEVEEAYADRRTRHIPCAIALVSAVEQTKEALDPLIGVTLALEVVFGMAKTMPMSRRMMEELAEEEGS